MNEDRRLRAAIRAEAAAWLARLRADGRTAQDEIEFHAWLEADPAHAKAFDEVTAVFDALGGLKGEFEVPVRDVKSGRRAILAGIGALVVGGAAAGLWRQAYAGVYESGLGEQRSVMLNDNTQILLDSETRIRVVQTQTRREASLERGRANFRIVTDPGRPFVVDTGSCRILSPAANFDVDCTDAARVSIMLIQGTVRFQQLLVGKGTAMPPELTLVSGQRLALTGTAISIDRPDPGPLMAWQTGRAVFNNKLLSEAIAELNRYSAVKLILADPALANLRLSGVYRLGATVEFAQSIAALLPVSVRRDKNKLFLLARGDGASKA